MVGGLIWLIGLLAGTTGVGGFIAYDCEVKDGDAEMHSKPINMLEVEECNLPASAYHDPSEEELQVIYAGSSTFIKALQCSLIYSKRVTRCGFNSLAYGSQNIAHEARHVITQMDCKKMAEQGYYEAFGKKFKIRKRQQIHQSFFTQGKVLSDGYCDTEYSFESEGHTFYHSVEETSIKLLLTEVSGTYDSMRGTVKFPTLGNLKGDYETGMISDAVRGTITWTTDKNIGCRDGYSEVYLGKGQLHRVRPLQGRKTQIYKKSDVNPNSNMTYNHLKESIILIERPATRQFAGLVLKGQIDICGKNCYATQINNMAVCFIFDPNSRLTGLTNRFDPEKADLISQMSYLAIQGTLAMGTALAEIAMDICELERRLIVNELQAVADGSKHALNEHIEVGSIAIMRGAVLYVQKCKPVEVVPKAYKNCTQQIPVVMRGNLNGTIRFANPRTMVLQSLATIVPCSALAPVSWKINDRWLCAHPLVVDCSAPRKLKPSDGRRWSFLPAPIGMGWGIFSQHYADEWNAAVERAENVEPVLAVLTDEAVKSRDEEGRITNLIPTDTWKKISPVLGPILNPLFALLGWLGEWFNLFFVGCFAFHCLSTVISLITRLATLIWERGFGLHLLTAFSDALWSLSRMPAAMMKSAATEAMQSGRGSGPGSGGAGAGLAATAAATAATAAASVPLIHRALPNLGPRKPKKDKKPKHPISDPAEERAAGERRRRSFFNRFGYSRAPSEEKITPPSYHEVQIKSAASFPDGDPFDGNAPREESPDRIRILSADEEYVVHVRNPVQAGRIETSDGDSPRKRRHDSRTDL